MMGDLGSQNLFQLIAQWGVEDADDDEEEEEEGGNRGERTSVAFPRVAEKKEVLDDPQNTWMFFCLHREPVHDATLTSWPTFKVI